MRVLQPRKNPVPVPPSLSLLNQSHNNLYKSSPLKMSVSIVPDSDTPLPDLGGHPPSSLPCPISLCPSRPWQRHPQPATDCHWDRLLCPRGPLPFPASVDLSVSKDSADATLYLFQAPNTHTIHAPRQSILESTTRRRFH